MKLQVTPSSELKPSVTRRARRRSDAISSACSRLWLSCDASPGLGGFTSTDMATWPTVLGDRLMDAILYISSTVPGWMLVISM